MGSINDKYKHLIEHSILLNSNPDEDHTVIGDNIFIKPKSYSRPEISEVDKASILHELSLDLTPYGLHLIDLEDDTVKIKAENFELIVPKKLLLPYDDAIFADILK